MIDYINLVSDESAIDESNIVSRPRAKSGNAALNAVINYLLDKYSSNPAIMPALKRSWHPDPQSAIADKLASSKHLLAFAMRACDDHKNGKIQLDPASENDMRNGRESQSNAIIRETGIGCQNDLTAFNNALKVANRNLPNGLYVVCEQGYAKDTDAVYPYRTIKARLKTGFTFQLKRNVPVAVSLADKLAKLYGAEFAPVSDADTDTDTETE